MRDVVVVLGARGSVPVSAAQYAKYGGATTCVLLRLCGQTVLLDAGTGMLDLAPWLRPEDRELPVLLSHPHADHLLGLPLCPAAFGGGRTLRLYAVAREDLGPEAQLRALMRPPLWPVGPEQLPAKVEYQTICGDFSIGPVQVAVMEGDHPGGVTLFRLSAGGKRVVFLTDCTLTEALLPKVTEFARDCDLLLCDGQYEEAEWPDRMAFGHSTWSMAARLGRACGAKQVRIIHHDPGRTDCALDRAAAHMAAIYPSCAFARAGEEIEL